MIKQNLSKGFEVELFTGSFSGDHRGIASEVIKDLSDFVNEPDQRNIEYITLPKRNYDVLKSDLLLPRIKLRRWLLDKKLTILPGSTLSKGNSQIFERSDLLNKYHDLIEKKYGADVVTTSVHINLGIENLSFLFAALRLIRCEAALLLAISASSPFLDSHPTGAHSQRWLQFPLTPQKVPIFKDHSHYINWVEIQLNQGIMSNERHLWTSIRPNGPTRPYELNRLELRICDLITDSDLLLAVTALYELRVISLMENIDALDPLKVSKLSLDQLAVLSDSNDQKAAKHSLDAILQHWEDGREIACRQWIEQLVDELTPLAIQLNMVDLLKPIHSVLKTGNQAMRWLNQYAGGRTIESILKEGIASIELEERSFVDSQVITGR